MLPTEINILLIDDDEDAYVATRHLLSSIRDWKIHLDWAETYDQGLKALEAQTHDLYFIDYWLDSHDGLELLKESVARGCRAPMIMLTGLKDREVDIQAMQAGAADYIVKDRLDSAHLERCIRYNLERRRLQEQLEDRARRLRALAGQLSHAEQRERSRVARLLHDHLQQILVSAKMHLESMTRDNLPKHRGDVQGLLDQVMDISRTLTVELSPPILMDAGLAAGLEWLAKWMHVKHELHVIADIDEEAEPTSESARLMLFHAARELLFNVVKHAQVKEAHLTMRRTDDDQVCITIADQGAGFDPQCLEQGPALSSGFGLAHLHERVQLIGGKLDVEAAPGQGCRVTLTAPRQPFEPAAGEKEQEQSQSAAARANVADNGDAVRTASNQFRVLLVDDHPVMREGLARTLADHDDIAVVGEAADGQEAIELTRELQPDVILMDIIMPRLNGLDATWHITNEWPNVRVIGLSMYNDAEVNQTMRNMGAVAYVGKGEPIEILLEHIRGQTVTTSRT